MNRLRYAAVVITALVAAILLGPNTVQADGLTVYANAIKFANPAYDSVVRIDFPFSVNRNEFQFSPLDPGSTELFARIFADVVLYDSTGTPVDSTSRLFLTRARSFQDSEAEDVRIFNFLSLFAAPGSYSARVTVIDADSKAKGDLFIERLKIGPPDRKNVRLSEAILSYDLEYVGDDSAATTMPQVRNGFFITPNPSRVFADTDSSLHIYAEAYNLRESATDSVDWWLQYAAYDDEGELFLGLGGRQLVNPGRSAVITERFDIKGWPTGVYSIHMKLENRVTRSSSNIEVPLRIISPSKLKAVAASAPDRTGTIPGDPYERMTLKQKEQLVAYMLTPEQKRTLSSLSDRGKENFLSQFWREKDIDPTTRAIENRFELIERYRYVNERFSTNEERTNGWNQDRGRIYMTYGQPYQINDFAAPVNGDPFTIWYYYLIEEGKYFIFVDPYSSGEYRLAHSNVDGEPYDKAWQEMVNTGRIEELDLEN